MLFSLTSARRRSTISTIGLTMAICGMPFMLISRHAMYERRLHFFSGLWDEELHVGEGERHARVRRRDRIGSRPHWHLYFSFKQQRHSLTPSGGSGLAASSPRIADIPKT